MQTCKHTYLRWDVDNTPVCAVCKEAFDYIAYDAKWNGVFPREDIEQEQRHRAMQSFSTTMVIGGCDERFSITD